MRVGRAVALIGFVLVAGAGPRTCCKPDPNIGEVLNAIWRSGGNAVLFLDSDLVTNRGFTIDLSENPYPPEGATDKAFYGTSRVTAAMQSTNLSRFRLLCGRTDAKPNLKTWVVFWSDDNWAGSKQLFQCGDGDFDVESTISAAKSFCVVSELSPSERRSRCKEGPRCDDEMRNGSESDTDCGGSCNKCSAGKHCNGNSDCSSNSCLSGTCHNPSCTDGIKNQGESDIDCGGPCGNCSNGKACSGNGDCQSGYCSSGQCKPKPTCSGAASTSSASTINVLIIDAWGCGGSRAYFANSLTEAKGCASTDGWTPVSQLCAYTFLFETNPNYYSTMASDSAAHAESCGKHNTCSSCIWILDSTGSCISQ